MQIAIELVALPTWEILSLVNSGSGSKTPDLLGRFTADDSMVEREQLEEEERGGTRRREDGRGDAGKKRRGVGHRRGKQGKRRRGGKSRW
jgi:hypothetical protein